MGQDEVVVIVLAPTAIISPLTSTENPNVLHAAASDGVIFRNSPQLFTPPVSLVWIYADPDRSPLSLSPGEPTTATLPSIPTDCPYFAKISGSLAV